LKNFYVNQDVDKLIFIVFEKKNKKQLTRGNTLVK
jgi:hypothetical protein